MNTLPLEIEDWCGIVRAEYLEMPGLHLTESQVQRLWNFDARTSQAVLHQLVAAGFLTAHDNAYVLADAFAASRP